ncbi:pyruvate, phosphate dikinase [Prosthecomicrobium pneumaticum]|uniref:Pyruvate, phosphate dikinase n=1 Tax=Prosthecomicrobium pneumaticum TaxID=81895 RepID=A0A7W9CUQ6_9HYPH|nr:pyruvate, phosphate dikinase [Prosthecomicrobium pneumaticum]MBB5751951.1 pyruvate,orthophosphate dikinase [Prosthecomicrobium pneumaticum]
MVRWIYRFGDGVADEGGANAAALLGAKGAALAAMARLGLPVPAGFTIGAAATAHHLAHGRFPNGFEAEFDAALGWLEALAAPRPPVLALRPSPERAMPGLEGALLDLGLGDIATRALAQATGDPAFAQDCRRRFLRQFGETVLRLDPADFEERADAFRRGRGLPPAGPLGAEDGGALGALYAALIAEETGTPPPDALGLQLATAIEAALRSWRTPRAIAWRSLTALPDQAAPALVVQTMAFGNLGRRSGAGLVSTRDAETGAKRLAGSFLAAAQGDEIKAGARGAEPLDRLAAAHEAVAAVREGLVAAAGRLEAHFRDAVEFEFTVEDGRLFLLDVRPLARSTRADLAIAVGLAGERIIDRREAVARIDPASLDHLLHPRIDPAAPVDLLARGVPASPGAATGVVAFSAAEAEDLRLAGRKAILVRVETGPEDVHAMHAAAAILTVRGGMTSHAAVIARGMGKPCVAGAGTLRVDARAGTLSAGERTVRRGDTVTLDGGSGAVMVGAVPLSQPELTGAFATLMDWADGIRTLRVRANAETVADANIARAFGAEGIGLCRSEHMFFESGRTGLVRAMILAETVEARREALAALLPLQRADFARLFTVMAGHPVTVRLLDPPLHEFLPRAEEEIAALAGALGMAEDRLRRRLEALAEANPMLGHRGCRLAITFPEIAEMQARAILDAALDAAAETGAAVVPQIMVPLVASRAEFDFVAERVRIVAQAIGRERGAAPHYEIGTMIELPRAALRAGAIAESAAFFSFGTNDLTQTTYGISRDDAAAFLRAYVEEGLMPHDPFATLDHEGVGELVRMAAERGRATRPDLELGICGEHGGDPASIRFCAEIGLDYVSCSPFRVPIARLAAAQAAIAAEARTGEIGRKAAE